MSQPLQQEAEPLLAIDPILEPGVLIYSNNESSHLLSKNQAILSLSKGIAGAGLFSLSFGLSQAGLLTGVVIMILVTFLAADTVKLLVACKEYVEQSINQPDQMNKQSTAQSNGHSTAINQNPVHQRRQPLTYLDLGVRLLGPQAGRLVSFAVIACSVGVSTAYLDFIQCMGSSIYRSANVMLYPDQPINHSIRPAIFMLPALPIVIWLSLIRSYRVLSLTALLGDLSIMIGTASVVLYGFLYNDTHRSFHQMIDQTVDNYQHHSVSQAINTKLIFQSNFPSFISTVAFLFCVHFFTLPIFGNLSNKRNSAKVIDQSFSISFVVSFLIGLIGWYCFAESLRPVIISNLPETSLTIVFVKIMLAVDMVLSYAIVMFPGREIIENWVCTHSAVSDEAVLDRELDHSTSAVNAADQQSQPINTSSQPSNNQSAFDSFGRSIKQWFYRQSITTQHVIVRLLIVLLTVFLSISIPRFDIVIGLVGGVSMCSLAFIFPCCMALCIHQANTDKGPTQQNVWHRLYASISHHSDHEANVTSLHQWWWRPWYFYTVLSFGCMILCLTIFQSIRSMIVTLHSDDSAGIC